MAIKYLALAAILAGAAVPALANDANHYFQKMDANGNGIVSRSEHNAFADRMFNQADTNRNGSLSQSELAEFKDRKHAEMNQRHSYRAERVYGNSNPNYDSNIINRDLDPKYFNSPRSERVYDMERNAGVWRGEEPQRTGARNW